MGWNQSLKTKGNTEKMDLVITTHQILWEGGKPSSANHCKSAKLISGVISNGQGHKRNDQK